MLTAAVRDLHKSYPDKFITDVRTPCPDLWINNPYITQLDEHDVGVEAIECQYPLIHRSNTSPWHFIHGFIQHLEERLGVVIKATDFKGDIHLSSEEMAWMSQVQELTHERIPFWIITAGGKQDFTIKWWAHERFQKVGEWEERGQSTYLGAPVKRASTWVKVPSVQLDGSAPKTVPTASPRGGVESRHASRTGRSQ